MWHECILKSEEISGFRLSMLLRFVDLRPNIVDVFIENSLVFFKVPSTVIEISQDEEKSLGRLLFEQLQIDFEDDLKETIVRSPMSTNICSPHIDK